MEFHFTIQEDDFLTYQLFKASTEGPAKRRRFIMHISLSLASFLVAYLLYDPADKILAIYFAALGLLIAIFYPWYSKRRLKSHFRSHIRRNYSERFGQKVSIDFREDHILSKDEGSENRVENSEVRGITELPGHYLVALSGGHAFILSKHTADKPEQLREVLRDLAQKTGVAFEDWRHWSW